MMDCFVEPLPDCESRIIQVGAGSYVRDRERSSSSSLSKSSNSSPDSIKDVDNTDTVQAFNAPLRTERARSTFTMQQYNTQQLQSSMAYDDSSPYNFHGTTQETTFSRSGSDVTPNMMLNFGGVMDRLDASACFPGLGELPSNGLMEASVEHNLGGTFTGDLNSSAYEVGDPDHGCLLQEMLQPTPPPTTIRLPDAHSQVPAPTSHCDWEDSLHALQEMVHLQHHPHHLYPRNPQPDHPQFTPTFTPTNCKFPSNTESDLLNLLHFPRLTPTPPFPYPNLRSKAPLYSPPTLSHPVNPEYENRSMLGYDPGHQFQQQRYFHKGSSNEGVRMPGANVLLVDLEQEREDAASGKGFQGGKGTGKGESAGKGAESQQQPQQRGVNHFATERQRREFLNEKYHMLRSLVPNPTKADRASIVADAIEYVKELKRMVQELQQLVQEKRRAAGDASSVKRRRASLDGEPYNKTMGSSSGQENNGGHLTVGNDGFSPRDGSQLQCSWLQQTSLNGAHVDVRVMHDEVTIKVNHRRSKSSLLFCVLALLQDLQLNLVHASGATIGEHDVFLFNTKIFEGSSTFAGYIAVKLLDTLDRHLVI